LVQERKAVAATNVNYKMIVEIVMINLALYLDGLDVNTGIFDADAVRNILDL